MSESSADPSDKPGIRPRNSRRSAVPATGLRIVCTRADLSAACQIAALVVPADQNQPVLKNLKLVADGRRCTIEAMNQEYGIRLEVPGVKVTTGGRILIPADRLASILRETSDHVVAIEAANTTTLVRTDQSEFELTGEDVDSYPEFTTPKPELHNTVLAGQLREAIHRTRFAAAKGIGPASLAGTLWELDDNEVRLVATDGKRLALARCAAKARGGSNPPGSPHIVPPTRCRF